MDAGPSHSQHTVIMDLQDMNEQNSEPYERQPAGWPLPSPAMPETAC